MQSVKACLAFETLGNIRLRPAFRFLCHARLGTGGNSYQIDRAWCNLCLWPEGGGGVLPTDYDKLERTTSSNQRWWRRHGIPVIQKEGLL